jgi:hypothetical protein
MDGEGHPYICGSADNTLPTPLDTFIIQKTNHFPFFVAGLDSNFKAEWVRQSFGGDARPYKCSLVGNNLYLHFGIDSCVSFDTLHQCKDPYYSYIVNCNKNDGSLKWFLSYSGDLSNGITAMNSDKNGNCYFGGLVWSDSPFQLQSFSVNKQIGSRYNGLFGKVDSNGVVQWIKTLSGTKSIGISKIISPNNGDIYCLGIFTGTATIGGFTISTAKTDDYFIARFDSAGNCIGAMALPSAVYNDFGVDKDGSLVFTGTYYGSVTFGGIPLTVGAGLGHDFFVAKLSNLTGIEEVATIKKGILRIFANPSQGNFKIEIPEDLQLNKTAQLQITDALGKLLKDETILVSQSTLEIGLGIVPKGVYYVSLKQEQLYYTGNVVVE